MAQADGERQVAVTFPSKPTVPNNPKMAEVQLAAEGRRGAPTCPVIDAQ